MNRFILGFRALYRAWTNKSFADQVAGLFDGAAELAVEPEASPTRSEALTFLAVLQREARFVDFVQEPIDAYPDAQIGAAVRDVHKGCRTVLDRLLELEPLAAEAEGSPVTVPAGADPGRFQLVGNVTGEPPFEGTLAHHGWQARHCTIPEWSGREEAALIVAPAEVELA